MCKAKSMEHILPVHIYLADTFSIEHGSYREIPPCRQELRHQSSCISGLVLIRYFEDILNGVRKLRTRTICYLIGLQEQQDSMYTKFDRACTEYGAIKYLNWDTLKRCVAWLVQLEWKGKSVY